MKTRSFISTLAVLIAMEPLLTQCSMEGRVIESRRFNIDDRVFVQDRIVVTERPVFETRVVSRQVR
jgi:hypothetical protein